MISFRKRQLFSSYHLSRLRYGILFFLLFMTMILSPVSIWASSGTLHYVTDDAGLLSDSETSELETEAESISAQYGTGVFIVTVQDYTEYSEEGVFDAAASIYHNNELGEGEERNGILLLLSMEDRDYAIFCYGKDAKNAFNSYGQKQLEDSFLDDFGEDDWYDGFSDYLSTCEEFLDRAASGHPVRQSPLRNIVWAIVIGITAGIIVVAILASMMKNVSVQANANAYVRGDLHLTRQVDRFNHRETVRRRIEKSEGSSGGSQSHTGGGGTGRSGKF